MHIEMRLASADAFFFLTFFPKRWAVTNWAKFLLKTCSVWLQTCSEIPFSNKDAAAEVDLNFHSFSGSQGFIKLPVQSTNGVLLFGHYWLVGGQCLAS